MTHKRIVRRIATCISLALGALAAAPASAQSYNQNLDAEWLPQTTTGAGNWRYFSGVKGLTYFATDAGGNNNDVATAAVVQPDGKVVVGGTAVTGQYVGCEVRRFLPDGTADPSFGNAGTVFYNMAYGDCSLHSVALQSDGSIYVGGQFHDELHSTYHGFVFRLKDDGTTDAEFDPGESGHVFLLGDDIEQILLNGDNIIAIGSIYNGSDDDFFAEGLTPTGDLALPSFLMPGFNLGGDNHDRASAGVLESFVTTEVSGSVFTVHHDQELYIVGTADASPWTANHPNSNCAIAAYRSVDGGAWVLDKNFDSSGKLNFGAPIIYANASMPDTQTLCYSAMALPQSSNAFGPELAGIVVGGERYFNHVIYPFSADRYDNSAFGMARIVPSGQTTEFFSSPLDAYYEDLFGADDYNSIRGIVRQSQGMYLVAGLAGTNRVAHAPSDMGTMMLDGDFNKTGTNLLSLDGELAGCNMLLCNGLTTSFPAATEAAGAVALDAWRGRAYIVGNRHNSDSGSDDWLIGSVRVSDRIFADNLDGTPPD
jgi:uncharacterized delta-60 repeat protein